MPPDSNENQINEIQAARLLPFLLHMPLIISPARYNFGKLNIVGLPISFQHKELRVRVEGWAAVGTTNTPYKTG